nr:MAG TPA: hypothetical protein [Caudoviricetes sp.]DAN68835.1 MAG TPA: hypothetical protein [Caudoviricetes sp.]DAV22230.1 MAG TPA: hypothetical protein [Caudoviricetes sp.]DAX67420.1 MAG TPA: hypothetical protein [Caudoviricetes sp.]
MVFYTVLVIIYLAHIQSFRIKPYSPGKYANL